MTEENKTKILITELSHNGISETIGSAAGFGSWTIGSNAVHIKIDPAIDITTDEGKAQYCDIQQKLTMLMISAHKADMKLVGQQDARIGFSVKKRNEHMVTLITNEME